MLHDASVGNLYRHIKNSRTSLQFEDERLESPIEFDTTISEPPEWSPRWTSTNDTPHYLPKGCNDSTWESFDSELEFDIKKVGRSVYTSYKLWINGKLWVLFADIKGKYICRTKSWSEIGEVKGPTLFLPAADPKSKWVPFCSEEGFQHLPYEQVMAADGIYWVNLHKDDVPAGESMTLTRQHAWADHYGYLTLPAFLPRRPFSAVWVPYPTAAYAYVPPSVRWYPGMSGKMKDGLFWVLHPNEKAVPIGERSFPCRTTSFAVQLGIDSLPMSLPKGPEGSVWIPYPSEQVFLSLKGGKYFPTYTRERNDDPSQRCKRSTSWRAFLPSQNNDLS